MSRSPSTGLAGQPGERVDAPELGLPVAGIRRLGARREVGEVEARARDRPVGAEVAQVGLEEAGKLVEQAELRQQPGRAREGERVRRVAQPDDERRAAAGASGGCGPLAIGRSPGVRPPGSPVMRNGTRSSVPRVVSTAAPSRSERAQGVPASGGERWASRTRGSKATRAPASAGRPAKRLSNVARA